MFLLLTVLCSELRSHLAVTITLPFPWVFSFYVFTEFLPQPHWVAHGSPGQTLISFAAADPSTEELRVSVSPKSPCLVLAAPSSCCSCPPRGRSRGSRAAHPGADGGAEERSLLTLQLPGAAQRREGLGREGLHSQHPLDKGPEPGESCS